MPAEREALSGRRPKRWAGHPDLRYSTASPFIYFVSASKIRMMQNPSSRSNHLKFDHVQSLSLSNTSVTGHKGRVPLE
jgi:hypothetical protein